MNMWLFGIIVIAILWIILFMLTVGVKHCEAFTVTGLLSVPTSFYDQATNEMPSTHYAYEFNDRFFLDALTSVVEKTTLKGESTQISKKMGEKIQKRTTQLLLDTLNQKLGSTEVFLFNSVFEQITNVEVVQDPFVFKVRTEHILYRDTKVYGVGIWLESLHDPTSNKVTITDFGIMGYVFEDRLNNIVPSNLLTDTSVDPKENRKIMRDPKYEREVLCQTYRDIKKYKGMTVDGLEKCGQSSEYFT